MRLLPVVSDCRKIRRVTFKTVVSSFQPGLPPV
jgi:hypothetical protein